MKYREKQKQILKEKEKTTTTFSNIQQTGKTTFFYLGKAHLFRCQCV